MPSLLATVIGAVLRATGTYRKRYSDSPDFLDRIAKVRAEPLQVPTAKMRAQLDVREDVFEGRPVWHIAPKGREPTAHLLYFHGGGYVYSAVDVHWKFYEQLAGKYGLAITAPMYPLAPEADAQETTDWAFRAYKHFAQSHSGPFVLGGDSAGGGLASVVAQRAKREGLRQAAALVLVCPWLDTSVSHPDQLKIEKRDCILTVGGARGAGKIYARDLPQSDPRVSPIHGDWTGLPPMLVFGGGDDILVVDARALHARLPDATYVEGAGLMHDWPIFFLKESRAAQAQIADFAVRAVA